MPGLGFSEMLFIFVAALLLFGPRRLPELGRTLGKGLAEFRRASAELRRSLDAEGLENDLRETQKTIRSVDPRRYVKEALMGDEASGRVARGSRPATGDDAPADDPATDPPATDDPAHSDPPQDTGSTVGVTTVADSDETGQAEAAGEAATAKS